MRDRLLKQANREYDPRQRLALLAPAGVLFLVILPLALIRLGGRLDRLLDWPALALRTSGVLTGWLLAIWTIYVQFTLGRHTPVPVMATQKMIICPPTHSVVTPWPWALLCSTWA